MQLNTFEVLFSLPCAPRGLHCLQPQLLFSLPIPARLSSSHRINYFQSSHTCFKPPPPRMASITTLLLILLFLHPIPFR